MNSAPEVLVVGGGPAGAALGVLLARQGRTVEIVERSAGAADRMCGEFYSEEAVQYLASLGVDLHDLGAMPIRAVRLAAQEVIAESALPFTGLSLQRRLVDEHLLARSATAGATVTRGCGVESLTRSHDAWIARLSDGTERSAAAAFVATGKHDLRGWKRSPGAQNGLVAFKMYFALTPQAERELFGNVELILFSGGYAGLQMTGAGCANLTLLVTGDRLQRCGRVWSGVLEHATSSSKHLLSRLEGAVPLLPKPLALASIPYGYQRGAAAGEPWYLGDQCAVIPSFTGDGVSIALHSAHAAAEAYQQGRSAAQFQRALHQQLHRPVQLATCLSRLMIRGPGLAQIVRFCPSLLRLITQRTRVPPQFRNVQRLSASPQYTSTAPLSGGLP